MKDNLFNPTTQQTIVERIQKLTPDHPRQWGKMTPSETLCHMADPFRDVLNLRQTKPAVWPIFRPLIRMMVLTENDWKPNTPTLPVYRQGEGGGGTPPTDFESDRPRSSVSSTSFAQPPPPTNSAHTPAWGG